MDQDEEDEDEESAPDAPRCLCGRRSRQGRVQLPGTVAKRPYFRCGSRSCRFFSFGELPATAEAQALSWVRLRTVPPHVMAAPGQHLVVVGRDGFRPEDARLGPQCESLGAALFVDALAVLTERPSALQRLLPNATATSGCHEIRLCTEGIWRALLIDDRLPMVSASQDKKNFHELLAFGRCAGNQLWIPLLEKAYAKAHGAYQFAFPGTSMHVFLQEMTGSVVEQIELGKLSRSSSGDCLDREELWTYLLRHQREGTLLACLSRFPLQTSSPSAFAVLDMMDSPGSANPRGRAVRLRNPRVSGSNAAAVHERILALLRGSPAETSTYADGSFWVQFTDFLAAFSEVCICHAASTGGALLPLDCS